VSSLLDCLNKSLDVENRVRSEAANEAVTKGGKLELLVVAAQQIAAGTAQLVVSSRVKADRKSGNLSLLSQASRGVSTATGAVVAAAKACRNMVETAGKYFLELRPNLIQ
jgi:huntingtin interacting protein 1